LTAFTPLNDPGLVRAIAHPLRARILGILQERRASPKELAAELGLPLANVAYHVRILSDLKLIRLVKKTPRRGAIEHHYEAVTAARVNDSAWAATPAIVRDKLLSAALDEVGRSVDEAAASGGFDRNDTHLTRTRLVLDDQAWSELGAMLMDVLHRADALQREAAERLKAADHQGEHRANLVMMLFEGAPAVPSSPEELTRHERGDSRKAAGRHKTRARAASR
jgi:DNA-binding transcriptional ArsR family regulator